MTVVCAPVRIQQRTIKPVDALLCGFSDRCSRIAQGGFLDLDGLDAIVLSPTDDGFSCADAMRSTTHLHLDFTGISMSGGGRPRRPAQQRARAYRHAAVRYSPGSGGESEISCCVKYSVFGFNVVFFILGFALLLVGVWAQIEKTNLYSQLNRASKLYLDPTWLLIVIGLITFIIGFSGCVGSLRENTSFLTFYSTLLGLLLIAEFAGAVFAYACKDQLDLYIRKLLNDVIEGYRDDPDLQILIDTMQEAWNCCGINNADDWDENSYFSAKSHEFQSPEAGGVPFSCCINSSSVTFKNFFCGHGVRLKDKNMPSAIYTEGCLPKLQLWLNNNVFLVGIVMVIVAVIQILGICFAQNLKSDIFAQRAKWYLDH